jgi:hypothetical protein
LTTLNPSPAVRESIAAILEIEVQIEGLFEPPEDDAATESPPETSATLTLSWGQRHQLEALAGAPLPVDLCCLLAARGGKLLEGWLFEVREIAARTLQAHREGLHRQHLFLGEQRARRLVYVPSSTHLCWVDKRWSRQRRLAVEDLLKEYLDALFTPPTNLVMPCSKEEAIELGIRRGLGFQMVDSFGRPDTGKERELRVWCCSS